VPARTQLAPESTYPGSHEKPHEVPSHVAAALAGGAQAVHELPHVSVLELLAHWPLHSW
jgi:hypothetical protein